MSDDTEFNVGLVAITMRPQDVDFRGIPVSAGRGGAEQDGKEVRVATHTIVPKEIGGRGVAAELVDRLVGDARDHDFKIDPRCSYVEKKFDENPDWSDLRA